MKKNMLFITALVFLAVHAIAKEGVYIEFKMAGAKFSGTTKTYSCDGNNRSEMNMTGPSMPSPVVSVSLVLKDAPHKLYTLNEKDKTYSELETNKDVAHKEDEGEYEVTVVGKEKINNYNCVHVKVRYNGSQHEREMWLSKDVIGWANYTVVKSSYLAGSRLFDALKAKGAEGFIVRMVSDAANGEKIQMDLIKAEKRNIDESLFSLNGYTKTAARAPGSGYGGMDLQAMQKMTPEERKQYIKEMQEKAKQQH